MKRVHFIAAVLALAVLALARTALAAQQVPPTGTDENPRLHYESGLLSLQARDVPLGELLHAIGAAAGFKVTIGRDLDAAVDLTLTRQPLPQVFRRLLEKNSYLVFFDQARNVSELRVLSAAAGNAAPTPQPAVVEVDEPTRADLEIWILDRLASPEQDARIVAVRRIDELDEHTAFGLASNVLQTDSNPVVRREAVAALGRIGGERAVETLGQLSSTDADSAVRLAALRILQALGGDNARYYLEQARADGDAAIRQFAEQALEAGERPAAVPADSGNGDGAPVTQ